MLLGCVASVLLLMFLAVTGGVVYLALDRRGGPAGPTPAHVRTFTGDGFAFDYPVDWEQRALSVEDAGAGKLVEVRSPARITAADEVVRDAFTVYRFESKNSAGVECEFQAGFLSFLWEDPGTPQEFDPADIDGVSAAHHGVTGTESGVDAAADTWCMDVDTEILQITAATFESHEHSAEIQAILDSWTWQ